MSHLAYSAYQQGIPTVCQPRGLTGDINTVRLRQLRVCLSPVQAQTSEWSVLQKGCILQGRSKLSYLSEMMFKIGHLLIYPLQENPWFSIPPPHGKANCQDNVLDQHGIRARLSQISHIPDYIFVFVFLMDLNPHSHLTDTLATLRKQANTKERAVSFSRA